MSKVPNPLHDYRSTQYHFVLIASASSNTATVFDKEEDVSDLSRYMHPDGGPQHKYDKKDIQGSEYVVIYNSMTDVEFSIDTLSLEYKLLTGGSSQNYQATNAETAANLRMEIIEPYTADFLDVLQVAAGTLGTSNVAGLNYGLKIIFVGYPDDNNASKPHIIADVNMISFILTEISMSLTARGAHYDIECTPLFNNAANHHSASKIGGVTTKLPETLSDAVTKFETEANNQVQKAKDANPEAQPYKYKIVLDDAYKDPKYNLDVVADDQRDTFNGSKPLTKNNTPSGKVPNFADQTAEAENKPDTATTPILQSEKNTEGVVSKNSDKPIVTSDPGFNPSGTPKTSIISSDPKFLEDAENKLRSLDKDNYARYKEYRDNDFITSVQNGVNPEKALNDARIKASQKFGTEITNVIEKNLSPNPSSK